MSRVVPVHASGVRTDRTAEGLRIDLERRRPWWRYFAPLWIFAIMGTGLVFMLTGEPPENSGGAWFLVAWVVFAAVLGGHAVWLLLHRERLVVGPRTMAHTRALGPITLRREYERSAIKDLRVEQRPASAFGPPASLFTPGSVAFNYGSVTVRVADVDDPEAKRIVAALSAELGQA